MAEAIGEAKATEKQREIAKAWLRHMIAHANRKAAERLTPKAGS